MRLSILLFSLFSYGILAAETKTDQTTSGHCSPAIANVTGSVSIICSDPKAIKALISQMKKIEALMLLSNREKEDSIRDLKKTITGLIEKREKSDEPDKYDLALDAIAKRDPGPADELLDDAIAEYEKNITKAAELYREKGALWFASNTEKSQAAYQRAVELIPGDLDSRDKLGYLYRRAGKLDIALAAYNKIIVMSDNEKWEAIAFEGMGLIYDIMGEMKKAEDFFQKALIIYQKRGNEKGMAAIFGDLGGVYQTQEKFDRAEKFHRRALKIYERLGSEEGMANCYDNLGIVYRNLNEFDKAIKFHQKALELNETLGRKEGLATNYVNLGNVYLSRRDLDKAEFFYQNALAIDNVLSHKAGMAADYGNLGNVYRNRGELNMAEEYYLKALEINQSLNRKKGKATNYGNLGIMYASRGKLERAVEAWEKSRYYYHTIGAKDKEAKVQSKIDDIKNRDRLKIIISR